MVVVFEEPAAPRLSFGSNLEKYESMLRMYYTKIMDADLMEADRDLISQETTLENVVEQLAAIDRDWDRREAKPEEDLGPEQRFREKCRSWLLPPVQSEEPVKVVKPTPKMKAKAKPAPGKKTKDDSKGKAKAKADKPDKKKSKKERDREVELQKTAHCAPWRVVTR